MRAIDDPVQLAKAARIVRRALDRRDQSVAELVRRTRKEQGLPPTVEDPAVLAKVAALLSMPGTPVRADEEARRQAEQATAEADAVRTLSDQEMAEIAAKRKPPQALRTKVRTKGEKIAFHRRELQRLLNEPEDSSE